MSLLARSIAFSLLCAAASVQAAPWTYRGTLNDGGAPANGRYDIRLSLLDASGAMSLAYPLTFSGVEVHDGSFAIDVDFGTDLAQFGALKLKTEVAQGGSGFVALGEPKAFDAKAALAGVCWDTTGNSGHVAGSNFVGNIDAVPLDLRSSNIRVARLWKPSASSTNVLLGGSTNAITAGAIGASILGGGGDDPAFPTPNTVSENHGTVAGGLNNHVGDDDADPVNAQFATVSGGQGNYAYDYGATVGGGFGNSAGGYDTGYGTVSGGSGNAARGDYSTVPGGLNNQAAGDFSFAAGRSARVRSAADAGESTATCLYSCGDEGAFVWADALNQPFSSTGPNQFLLRASGGVGINTARLGNHPNLRSAELTVRSINGDPNVDMNLMTANARGYSMAVVPDGAAGAGTFYLQELNAISTGEPTWSPRLIITPSGQTQVQGGAVGTISDARLKKNIADIERPLDTLLALHGHRFEYLDPAQALGAAGTRIGFVAQEVREVLPHWVSENGNGYYSVAPSGFEALAVEAIREQQTLITAMQQRNRELQDTVQTLVERLAVLEAAKEH